MGKQGPSGVRFGCGIVVGIVVGVIVLGVGLAVLGHLLEALGI